MATCDGERFIDAQLESIAVYPHARVLDRQGSQQLAVTATFSDGRNEDITHLAQYSANEQDWLSVDPSGLVQALNIEPYPCHVSADDREIKGDLLIGAICNGRTAGGGQPLAPAALLDDGLLDVLIIRRFTAQNAKQALQELLTPELDGELIERFQSSRLDGRCDIETPFNLDGEPYSEKEISIRVLPGAVEVILPTDCPCVAG